MKYHKTCNRSCTSKSTSKKAPLESHQNPASNDTHCTIWNTELLLGIEIAWHVNYTNDYEMRIKLPGRDYTGDIRALFALQCNSSYKKSIE